MSSKQIRGNKGIEEHREIVVDTISRKLPFQDGSLMVNSLLSDKTDCWPTVKLEVISTDDYLTSRGCCQHLVPSVINSLSHSGLLTQTRKL